jgi:hypothetical protein
MSVIDKKAEIGATELDADFTLDLPKPDAIGIPLEGLEVLDELVRKLSGVAWLCDVGEA